MALYSEIIWGSLFPGMAKHCLMHIAFCNMHFPLNLADMDCLNDRGIKGNVIPHSSNVK